MLNNESEYLKKVRGTEKSLQENSNTEEKIQMEHIS